MKILHVINNLGSGGAEKLLSDILPRMQEQGNEVHLLISNGKSNVNKYYDILDNSGVKIVNLNTSFYNPFQTIKIIFFLRKGKYDIVHAHLFPSQYWVSFSSLFGYSKTKYVKTEHSVFNERKKYKILKPLEKFVYSRYQTLIGITEEVSINLKQWLEKKSGFITINNGVNLMQIKEAKKTLRLEDYDFLRKENYNVLMVGRFDGISKDQNSLIYAVRDLPEKVNLFFAGEGSSINKSKELVKGLNIQNRVHFLGMRTDVYALMCLVDLNVLSTNYEGLSGVVLESLASGKPFIGSAVVGVQEIVPNKGFLFEKQNPSGLKVKIEEIMNNQYLSNKLVDEALENIVKYDIKNMVSRYLEVYEILLKYEE